MGDPRWRGRSRLGDRGVLELAVQLRLLHHDLDRLAQRDELDVRPLDSDDGCRDHHDGHAASQTATVTEFYSPTKNISCEIDSANGPAGVNQALCLTLSPAQSATLTASGTLTKCSGQTCLSNAGENTPTLNYETSITLGSITCLSLTTGMKCTLSSGAGFTIASSGITPLGNVTVTTSTTSTTG